MKYNLQLIVGNSFLLPVIAVQQNTTTTKTMQINTKSRVTFGLE